MSESGGAIRIFRYSQIRTWLPMGLVMVVVSAPLWLPMARGGTTRDALERVAANGDIIPLSLTLLSLIAVGLWGVSTYGKLFVFEDRIERRAFGLRIAQMKFADVVAFERKRDPSKEGSPYRYTLRSGAKKFDFLSAIIDADELITLIRARISVPLTVR